MGKDWREVTCLRKVFVSFKSKESILPSGVYYALIDVRDTHLHMLLDPYVLNKVWPGTTFYHYLDLSWIFAQRLSIFRTIYVDLIIRVRSLIALEQITT